MRSARCGASRLLQSATHSLPSHVQERARLPHRPLESAHPRRTRRTSHRRALYRMQRGAARIGRLAGAARRTARAAGRERRRPVDPAPVHRDQGCARRRGAAAARRQARATGGRDRPPTARQAGQGDQGADRPCAAAARLPEAGDDAGVGRPACAPRRRRRGQREEGRCDRHAAGRAARQRHRAAPAANRAVACHRDVRVAA